MSSNIPSSMFAWRKHSDSSDPVWEEVPVPVTPPTGFLVKMIASGVCRSDHAILNDKKPRPWFEKKFTLGHEGCGEIVRIGDQVRDSKFKLGDVIALDAVPGCGLDDCLECSRDLSQLCQRCHHSGIGQDGFHAPYAAIDQRGAVLVPKGVTPAEAAVATDAVKTGYHAITRRGQVKANETVFLFGLGGLGFNALQTVLHIGARVIISDVKEELLEEAAKIGVPRGDIVPVGKSPAAFVVEHGLHIDTTLDFVGTHQTFNDAQQIVRRGGKIVCIGTLNLENVVDMKIGIRKRLSFIFSYGGQLKDLEEVLDLIANKAISPQVASKALSEFPNVIQGLLDGKIKGRIALMFDQ
ncbi:hypothetical protein V493_07051 [Pseudogymnoascus sp. VKM F-4281 (FW-2241)]|nr:hypothetical protein V493_07051 [Pseudogymnoascus sp. VKM F-4281 (FW-2241)]